MTPTTSAGRAVDLTPDAEAATTSRGAGLFCAVIVLAVAQHLPFLGEGQQESMRLALNVGVATFVVRALGRPSQWVGNRLAVAMLGLVVYVAVLTGMVSAAIGTGGLSLVTEIAIPTGLLLASACTLRREPDVRLFWRTYLSAAVALAVATWLHYGISIQSVSAVYLVAAKNQIGPIFGSAAVVALVVLFDGQSKPGRRSGLRHVLLYGALYAFLFVTLVAVRNRAGVLALGVVSLFFLLQWLARQRAAVQLLTIYGAGLMGLALYLVGALSGVVGYVWDSMTLNHDLTSIDGLSSGRLETYLEALAFVAAHPLLGASGGSEWLGPIPHNFVINKWVELGVLGSLPIVLFYLWLWLRWSRFGLAAETRFVVRLAGVSLLFLLIGSLVEYKLPLGPGASTASTWVLLGALTGGLQGSGRHGRARSATRGGQVVGSQ